MLNWAPENTNKLLAHYYLRGDSHAMNSFIRNKCEAEILAIIQEASDTLNIKIEMLSVPPEEGGFKDFWKIMGDNNNQITILLVIVTIILSRIPTTDQEIEALDKELKELSIEEKKLSIEKLKTEIAEKEPSENTSKQVSKLAKYVDRNLKIVKRRSNFYEHISAYDTVTSIGFNSYNGEMHPLYPNERIIHREQFSKFLISTNKLPSDIDDNASIEIIAPVLIEGRYRWKGLYNNETISFDMHDMEFKEQVSLEEVSFKHGSYMNCILRISRELNEVGEIKITGYHVTTVIQVTDGNSTYKTTQGRRYKYTKEFLDAQGKLFE